MDDQSDLQKRHLRRRPVPGALVQHDPSISVVSHHETGVLLPLSADMPPATLGAGPSGVHDGKPRADAAPQAVHMREHFRPIDSRHTFSAGPCLDALPESGQDMRRAKTTSAAASVSALLGQAQYLAGGLVSHPSESNRHFSIIRHSSALVWFRGPCTSVSITILSDEPLPAQRSLWLQQKGFSGDMGMALKALAGTTGSWLNVTPERCAGVDEIPEMDERGIQRDLKRFAKKASGRQKTHVARETCVVRIPAAATDGYFRLVLCAGPDEKKVACGSPVFRVASASTDSSVMRGASLSSMPLEVGVKVASTIGQVMVEKYAGVAATVMKSQAGRLVAANATVATVGQLAYDGYLGDAMSEKWQALREGRGDSSVTMRGLAEDDDGGPAPPFPVELDGTVVRGTGRSMAELGIPTANVDGVAEEVRAKMGGVFAAWAQVDAASDKGLSTDWHEAIVTIAPLRHARPQVAMKNGVAMHIIHDFRGAQFAGAKARLLLMGFLHPAAPAAAKMDELVVELSRDVAKALAALGRGGWTAEETMDRLSETRRDRGLSARLNNAKDSLQECMDRIPLHWAGVRSESGAMRDKAYGNGGIWIPR